jgi:peptide/nickel transport system substrate-binding protein
MRRRWAGALVAAAVLAAAAISVVPAGDVAAAGSTVVSMAELAPPNYIFPMAPLQFANGWNSTGFQALMYRPLFWYGRGAGVGTNWKLSLGLPPRFEDGGTRVVVTVKPWRWSDGERVTGQDVQFFMNLYKVEKQNFAGYTPGTMPDNLRSVSARGDTVTFVLRKRYGSAWFTDNQLGEITPFPLAWDVTRLGAAPGSGGCAEASWSSIVLRTTKAGVEPVSAAARACAAVFEFLSRESGWDPAHPKASSGASVSFATNPLWQVVDGPWHLTSFRSDGFVAMKPNPSYSGPVKPTISEFDELPFTSDAAEFNGLSGGKVSIGYLPANNVPGSTDNPTRAGPNNPRLAGAYNMIPWSGFGIGYLNYNFNSVGDGGEAGHLFRQLYFRQAMQLLIDQPLYFRKLYKGYGVPGTGPVPLIPANPYTSAYERKNPYPYNPARALGLLRAHGWHVVPNGSSVCDDAARCGVPAGTKPDLTLAYASGSQVTDEEMAAMAASWAQAGVHVRVQPVALNTLIGQIVPACSGSHCTWEIVSPGGIIYGTPYPSGEGTFNTGGPFNVGSYSDPTADRLIRRTLTTNGGFTAYENYIAQQLPFMWMPWALGNGNSMYEVQKNLSGVYVSPFYTFTPEAWRVS